MDDAVTRKIDAQIKRLFSRKPKRRAYAADEFVDECHFSMTGWAVWKRDGERTYCTCQPAEKPTAAEATRHD